MTINLVVVEQQDYGIIKYFNKTKFQIMKTNIKLRFLTKNLNRFFIGLFLLTLVSCQYIKKETVKFSDEITKYNYLDKEYDNIFIYDFENLLSNEEKDSLLYKIKGLTKAKGINLIFISNTSIGTRSNTIQNAYVLKDILNEKFSLNNTILFIVETERKGVSIVYDEEIKQLNSDKVKSIIDDTIVPQFQQKKYNDGIVNGIDKIFNLLL